MERRSRTGMRNEKMNYRTTSTGNIENYRYHCGVGGPEPLNSLGLTDANDLFFVGSSVWQQVRCGRPNGSVAFPCYFFILIPVPKLPKIRRCPLCTVSTF